MVVGFILSVLGFFLWFFFHYAGGYWWVFGGTLIFISPFMGAFIDAQVEKREDKIDYIPVIDRW